MFHKKNIRLQNLLSIKQISIKKKIRKKNLFLASQHRTNILLVTRFRPAHFYFGHAHFDRIKPRYRDIHVEIYT